MKVRLLPFISLAALILWHPVSWSGGIGDWFNDTLIGPEDPSIYQTVGSAWVF